MSTFSAAIVDLHHILPSAGSIRGGEISETVLYRIQGSALHPHVEAFYTIDIQFLKSLALKLEIRFR
jgi:hypothetical protein